MWSGRSLERWPIFSQAPSIAKELEPNLYLTSLSNPYFVQALLRSERVVRKGKVSSACKHLQHNCIFPCCNCFISILLFRLTIKYTLYKQIPPAKVWIWCQVTCFHDCLSHQIIKFLGRINYFKQRQTSDACKKATVLKRHIPSVSIQTVYSLKQDENRWQRLIHLCMYIVYTIINYSEYLLWSIIVVIESLCIWRHRWLWLHQSCPAIGPPVLGKEPAVAGQPVLLQLWYTIQQYMCLFPIFL